MEKIGVIGTGNMATGLANVFKQAGYHVTLGSRDAQKGQEVASKFGVASASVDEVIAQHETLFLAVPFHGVEAIAEQYSNALAGKLVVDITNPLADDYMSLTIGHTTSAGEEVAQLLPRSNVVKAFNTVFAQVLHEGPDFGHRKVSVFYASDNEQAASHVATIIQRAGFEPINAGNITNARYLEPLAELNIQLGYGLGRGTQIAPTFVERNIAQA